MLVIITSQFVFQLTDANEETVEIDDSFEFPDNEFWVFILAQEAASGNYTLRLEFSGLLDNGIVGFYDSVSSASRLFRTAEEAHPD